MKAAIETTSMAATTAAAIIPPLAEAERPPDEEVLVWVVDVTDAADPVREVAKVTARLEVGTAAPSQ
jgi:hypothetical protein